MVTAVVVIAALAFWDKERESEAALADFAREQVTLATSVAAELSSRIARLRADAAAAGPDALVPTSDLLEGMSRLESPHEVRILVTSVGDARLLATDGATVEAPALRRALAEGRTLLWLTRDEAAELDLPSRRAAAGIARIDEEPGQPRAVIVLGSAERVRDRELRASLRLVLGVTLAAGLVLLFGSVALREQRKELLLERELAIADLQRERDRALTASSRTATMGTLALGIAHELSTPLGIVAGRAEQLRLRTSGDDRAERCVSAILEQTARIERTVRGFLDLARGGKPEMMCVSPARVALGAVELVRHRFDQAGVKLTTDAAEPLPLVRCDVPMLEQALVNLLLNACDACDGGGTVSVTASAEGDRVVITVLDDGAGITEAAAARATEPFFTTKPAERGSGLGLAIANEIVKLHLGKLSIGPAAPRGTRVSLHIPIVRRDPQGSARLEEGADAQI
jgi:two-component system, NtrC family, sensor kinase